MAEFEVKTGSLRSAVGQEQKMAGRLASLCGDLAECGKALDVSVNSEYAAVKRAINGLGNRLSALSRQTYGLADALEKVYRAYEDTEREICGHTVSYNKIADAKNGVDSLNVSDGLSALSKWIKALNDEKDNPYAKVLASLLSMITSGMGLSQSENLAQWFQKFMGFSGSTIGLGSKLKQPIEDLINRYGTNGAKKWLQNNQSAFSKDMKGMGTIGGAVSFASEFYGAIQDSDSFAAFLKNSDGWLSSGGSLVGDLNGIEKEGIKGTVHPIVAMLSMAGYAAGDIIELSTDGHPLTADEISALCLNTGLTGAKTCVSQITFGLVDIDTQRSKGIFDKNIAWTTDKICSFDIPTWQQATLGVVATPFVALYSLGETFVDMGYQIGDGIMEGANALTGNLGIPQGAGASGGGGR